MQLNQSYKQKEESFLRNSRAILVLGFLLLFCVFYQVHAEPSENMARENSFWEKLEEKVEAFLGIELDDDDVEFGRINKASANNLEIPPQESQTAFSFAVVGDTQGFLQKGNGSDFALAVSNIKKEKPDLLMTVGDLAPTCNDNDRCFSGYEKWKNIIGSFEGPAYEVMGNHDQTNGKKSRQVWQDSFNLPQNGPSGYEELAYSFDFENAHFVVLASDYPSYHKIDKKQLNWLENDLNNNQQPYIFVFFHEPAYPASYKKGSALDDKKKDRDKLWEILDDHNVAAVFNGHEHMFSLKKIDNKLDKDWKNSVSQVIVGQTDAYEHSEKPEEGSVVDYYIGKDYVLVKIDGDKIALELRSVDGKLLNTYDISK